MSLNCFPFTCFYPQAPRHRVGVLAPAPASGAASGSVVSQSDVVAWLVRRCDAWCVNFFVWAKNKTFDR